jgi:hypothetical protein
MKWKVMKAFNLLPSSPMLREMNDAQWVWSYLNLLEDQGEKEELWKARLKYMGLFVNPDAVKELSKLEEKEKNPNYKPVIRNNNQDLQIEDNSVYTNSTFEDEMRLAMNGEDFMELPDPDEVRGNPNMSSEDFLLSVMDNIDQFSAIQQEMDLQKQVKDQGLNYDINYDLDIIQIDE